MFAAAAIVSRWIWDAVMYLARWTAVKLFVMGVLAIVLPWVLKGVLLWFWDFVSSYVFEFVGWVFGYISQAIADAGIDISINLTGVGGYLATQVGLIDYCSIIIAGWGLYWMVVLTTKAFRAAT